MLIKAAKQLRAAQNVYLEVRERYPEGHKVREAAGKVVEAAAKFLDLAIQEAEGVVNIPVPTHIAHRPGPDPK